MSFYFLEINWLSVIIATLVYSAFSGNWHKPFAFGKPWEKAMGFQRPDNWKESAIYFVVPSISCFCTCLTLALLMQNIKISSFVSSVTLGLITGIGIASSVTFTNAVIPTMKKPLLFGLITGSAHVFGITLASITLYFLN
jgi:hypothetical protein